MENENVNGGVENNFWDSKNFEIDIMSKEINSNKKVTKWTLAVFEDLNLYIVNYNYADQVFYKKNDGCFNLLHFSNKKFKSHVICSENS